VVGARPAVGAPVKVAVVSEFYPRAHDPVLGIWAHRQAVAARDAGADVRVLVLHRPVPPMRALRGGPQAAARAARDLLRQPRRAVLDGVEVEYVPFLSPTRARSYGSWGAYAAPSLGIALRRLRRRFPFDLVHAHNAVPAGDAVRRARIGAPLVVSVHGGDVYYTAAHSQAGAAAVRATLASVRLVFANSAGIERRARELGATATRVVRLGTDLPARLAAPYKAPTLVTSAHLVARKRHADVLRALWVLRDRRPDLRYLVIGDGPEREPLEALSRELGLGERVEFAGQLPHEEALERMRRAHLFLLPSTDEAFGVAYVEAMAGAVPAIAALGEPGPEEIAGVGDGLALVPPGDPEALAAQIDDLMEDDRRRAALGALARATVEHAFTWEACGRATVAAYAEALR
jgi:teichuronic acid biosynthesis glycosyltransferase TuaC